MKWTEVSDEDLVREYVRRAQAQPAVIMRLAMQYTVEAQAAYWQRVAEEMARSHGDRTRTEDDSDA